MSTKTYTENPDERARGTERERKKNTCSQSDQPVFNPEELQLHQNHEKILFLIVLLLFAQCKMNYW
jgi:hypothetical protein